MKVEMKFDLKDPLERRIYDFIIQAITAMDLTETDDPEVAAYQAMEIDFYKKAKSFYFAITNFDNYLRSIVKHGPTVEYSENELDTVYKIREALHSHLKGENVDLDMLP